ncbi:lamin tail domain-containing protein [Streptomyces sp. NPDC049967]|uniref:lamin tail domain-containing protein n=1 Tax=Streptomyces sp. NPDC049967 TaxID=3155658 RepID=UPI003419F43A
MAFADTVTAGPVPGWLYKRDDPQPEGDLFGQTGWYRGREKPARSVDVTMTATVNKAGVFDGWCEWGFDDNERYGREAVMLGFPLAVESAATGIAITNVFYKGQVKSTQADEYVEITNQSTEGRDLTGWKVNAGDSGQDFVFPQLVLHAGKSCRIYTNETHPEWGGFSFGSGRSIWNDTGDTAELHGPDGTLVSAYSYGSQAPSTPAESGPPPVPDPVATERIPSITVLRTSGRWIYTVVSGGRWVEFHDTQILRTGDVAADAAGKATGRWANTLPRTLWQGPVVVGVAQDPATLDGAPTPAPTYVFVKGDDIAYVTDQALVEHVGFDVRWPDVRKWLNGAPLQALGPTQDAGGKRKYLALSGDRYAFFVDSGVVETGSIATKWPFLPAAFRADVDSVTVVPESPRWKYLVTKGDQVLFFTDAGIAEGPRPISAKWPHLWTWMHNDGR